ncbi:MAG: DUF4381 domain-containing protein, partial [Akkermansiaceae bacterium]|nr:DUF4381 domain-containing protein [Akkermansiaceae bacterium]
PWWPPAPGWIVLATILLAVLIYYAVRRFRHWQADAYRRAALRELAAANSSAAIAEVLRRTALAIAPRENIAALSGSAWIDWLAARSSEAIPENVRTALSIYAPNRSDTGLTGLRRWAARWITRHTRPC